MNGLVISRLGISVKFNTLVIILLSLFVQLILIGKYLDNSVISAYAPTASDAAGYVARAQDWETDGFAKAFGDAYRMPGYPLVIFAMQFILPSAPYLGVRLLQMIALAISAGIVKIVLDKYVSERNALIASILYVLLPFWHFTPALLGESLTTVIVVAIIYVISNMKNSEISSIQTVLLAVLIGIATYLKPNNLMLLIIVSAFFTFSLKTKAFRGIAGLFMCVALLLSPWILFANHVQSGFIGLTTNSGANLYVGTGMVLSYDDSVLAKSAVKWKVDPKNNPSDLYTVVASGSPATQNSELTRKSIQIWRDRPISQIGYGIDKVLIAFGFKSNSATGYIFGLFNVASLIAGAVLYRSRTFRAWGFTILIAACLVAFQAVLFQADRRFVVPILFPWASVCLGLLLGYLPTSNLKKYSGLSRRGLGRSH